jgi:2-keto-4-pentenoate hydratase
MDGRTVETAAGALLCAYVSRKPRPPLSEDYPGLTVMDAYAIQLAQVAAWKSAGAEVKGHKVSQAALTLPKVQAGSLTLAEATALIDRPGEDDFLACGFVHIGVWGQRPR